MAQDITLTAEFSGGLEILFDNITKHTISLPSKSPTTKSPTNIGDLITHICNDLMKDTRKELFVLNGSIRPGILVLINDTDWELEGEDKYELKKGDNVLFVSTLHGG